MSDALLAARLGAQLLAGPPAGGVVDAVRHLLAVQAQDLRGARLALRPRSSGTRAAAVDAALADRSLVVTWLNRGTLHLVAAEDEPLLHAVTTPQLRTANARRLQLAGIDDPGAAVAVVVAALAADGPQPRAALADRLERAGRPAPGEALTHVLFQASLDGDVVRGPVLDGEHCFAHAADWLGPRPVLDRSRALPELARRFLTAHGPADHRDLAKWAQLGLRDARAGLQAIGGELRERPDGLLELARGATPALPGPRLLGPFDPVMFGWASRELVLDGAQGVVTSNAIFRAVVLVDGRVAGTWTVQGGDVVLDLRRELSGSEREALDREAADVLRFLA